ncbi:Dynein heavy chain C-terminal domain [Phytophthora infestans]|uniref:Dynein-1, subspecies f n=1 Tax=Phytophthora infestans TaxID=4787 RepID=A0A833SRK3_PHYIN|nr:Dynein heavy chain C-terminal domain [Phytophthora infestans]
MGGEDGERAPNKNDVNPLKYIEQRVATAFPQLVGPKFTAKYATEPNEMCIKEFLDNEDVTMLAFSGDNVIASIKMPATLPRGKTVCFTKFHKTAITPTNVLSDIMVNELTPSSVEYLERMVAEIYLPLFSNVANQEGWGEVASKEVVDKFHSYMASVSIISGATKGETCLPLPPIDGNATNLSNKVSLLEGSIVIWTKQIKNVLKQDPEDLLKQGLHPTPDAEIEFWKLKAANLNSIFDQLQSKKVRKILTALDRSKSTYCATFARLCKEVFTARIEANDNMKYLRTLEEWFIRLNNDEDFPALTELFKPMLHIILLIWKNSKHYNTPARLVVLMREICNSLINQARKYLSGELIFALIDQDEAGQAVEQLKTTLQVCSAFKSTYFDYKATANAECPSNPWRIQGNALFVRLDSFLERCHDILDLTQTIVQFSKLSKIEVGGTKGKTLTLSVQQIHADFTEAVNTFKGVSLDIMDVGASKFDDNFYDFRCKIKELERRLGSVLTQGFDDCSTIFGRFQLLDSFEGLLNRPIIQDELEKKHVALVQSYGHDLKLVQELFLHCRDAPPISWNLPPVAGALTWCRGLVERIEHPMKKLRELNQNVMEREEAKEVYKVYGTIMASLQEYENQKVEEWSRDVEASSQAKLKLPLLLRHPQTRCLRVNFDPALEKLLREIKYLRLLNIEVPQSALQISTKEETFRKYRGELMYIVEPYNAMIEGIHPLEEPLVRRHIQNIDACAGRGIEELNWKSSGIDTFIDECRKAVEGANEIVTNLKENLNTIQDTLSAWNVPLLERQAKPVAVSEHERQHKSYIVQRTLKIREGATEIHRRLKQSNTGIVGVNSAQWKAYVDFVNDIVVSGVARVICSSLEFLAKQLDPSGGKDGEREAPLREGTQKATKDHQNRLPMLEIKLDLIAHRVQFNPSIGENHGKGLSDTIQLWINSFFNVATAVKRLDSDGGGSYLKEMHSDMTISMMLATISEYEEENEAMLTSFKRKYDGYGYLWESDMAAHFQTFLTTAMVPGANAGADTLDLEKFNADITKYEQVASEIENLTTPTDIGWLRVNSQPIKTAMLTWVSKWVYQYTTYLHQHVVNKLLGLHNFMETVIKGLEEQVADKNKDALKRVMTHIRDVRKQMDATNELFDPLREAVHLLKLHGINVEDTTIGDHAVQDYLEAAPMQWEAIVNKTFKKKEEIMPLQMAEVESIKEELESFFLDMRKFRNEFRTTAPFSFQGAPNDAYAQMNNFASALHKKMQQAREFNELEELFELQVSKYQETTDTLYELQQLKKCWDLKDLVLATFDDWKSTLWANIQTDTFEAYARAFMKQLKMEATEHQIIKGWQVYKDTEQLVKNMSTVLPLINDLHSEAMQDRHWKALSAICHVKAIEPKDPKFCFADLLKLNLHLHVDDVGEIVETANKEQKIEKKLKMIEELWQRLTLEYVPHKDSGTFVVKPSEEAVESLESNQLELQTMIGMGKFVEFFKDRVLASQKTLGHVEEVLKEWVSVSKQWASLESIFLSSPDIRNQLPDDTRTFESIDSNFKDLMKNAVMEPNVVLACSVDSRLESLKEMTAMLEKCQKSLNEYLDKKKKIFPRFYFVSNVALLEILSNGNNPKKIMPFLGDCYDSLCDLVFEDDSPNAAHTMVAKDGESVKLPTIFTMAGAVESWLNELTEAMRFCLRKEMHDSIETAANWDVEKPRHQWLFDYPAQVVLNSTQIYWTEETEMALEEFENGQEDSVKRYLTICNQRLEQLINLVLGNLSSPDRCKIIALITLDVHSRDVVKKLVDEKVEGPLSFMWQQQLRFIWRQENYDVDIRITDFRSKYSYEWIGNTGRLVITPLTDRCYITLTMALRLFLGGAPAGPAGTGKTETTKDLARAMALCCYVFNCSDQMNYQTMADIFRGLCQTGTWGCFDEFNRINIEVLSVVATQVKCIQDAIVFNAVPANREAKYQSLPAGTPPVVVGEFEFMGASDRITLIPTCGFFITMNPGYAGRTELPENLKVLFRSCAMIRPDLKPICENMLMSEGFQQARTLAIKFVTLYELSGELLSKQFHYDWGLRAVKSVLRVAGILKRAEPDVEEDKVLMRALRDFNTPKIPHHDTPIFLRLINDLFIGVEVAPKVNTELREKAVTVCKANNLQHDDSFILKICQLQELIDVRHSVMLLGPAGCAKTTTWQALAKCWNLGKEKKICVYETLNPKAVTSDELYGYMTLSKDWKDGVLSIIMRGMAKNYSEQGFYESQTYKWVVLDGDIDAVWIESMNTVMDDNKVLTLVSNERIPLSSAMRMVFEINSLKNATPATVSRAGILFINEIDIGWRPFMESWVAKREEEVERTYLPGLFDKYVDPIYDLMRKGYKQVAPVRLINQVSTICYLLEGLLGNIPVEKKNPEVIESIFVFCATWAFGGPLIVDKSIDYRKNFHELWCSTFTNVKYPKEGLCFDYFYNLESGEFESWSTKVPKYMPGSIGNGPADTPFNSIVISTNDSVRIRFLVETLVARQRPAMLVGGSGTGKTTILTNFLRDLDDDILFSNINMNYYTDSAKLQQQLESVIDKRSGRMFGPPATKKLIYFIDDLNLPYIETYGTQNSLALLRQHMDYKTLFDRVDLGFRKEIVDVQYLSAMNPTAGSFIIDERLQRHYALFACMMPGREDLKTIYNSILKGHMQNGGFGPSVMAVCENIVNVSILLHEEMVNRFLPSATKFVYNWNMRELSNIFQGLTRSKGEFFPTAFSFARLWVHEATRVFCDRLINDEDILKFGDRIREVTKKTLPDLDQVALFNDQPPPPSGSKDSAPVPVNIFTTFATPVAGADSVYMPVSSMKALNKVLVEQLDDYNSKYSMMNLELFDNAMEHVTRICRIIGNPGGNAMLIGVGGSGKQSLSRLASHICGFDVRQLSVTSNFRIEDLKESLAEMFKIAGVQGLPLVFLMTDSQIVNERFLVYINDMLSSGWIPDLFPKEDLDGLLGSLRSEAKANGIPDAMDALMDFLLLRIRLNFRVIMCFSPVGAVFRVRARRFPGLVNCTVIDWFHPWPRDALVRVASSFLEKFEDIGDLALQRNLANHMADVHISVTEMSKTYYETQRRYNYVTPKSFLELISFYEILLKQRKEDIQRQISRLDDGLSTLRKTSADVAELQVDLKHTMVKVAEKQASTDQLLEQMGREKAGAEVQQENANKEKLKAETASAAAAELAAEAEKELSQAKPAMDAAAAAVDCLSKAAITELKSLPKPPAGVDNVTKACLILVEKEYKNHKWDRAKKMMNNAGAFLDALKEFKGEDIPEADIARIEPLIADPEFTAEKMASKSSAAANICSWVVNIYTFNRIYVRVKPLMDSLEASKKKKEEAEEQLARAMGQVAEVQKRLEALENTLCQATEEKLKVEEMKESCENRLLLAGKLVNGLASENERWGIEIEQLKNSGVMVVGNSLLAAAFVSYIGAFDQAVRKELWQQTWFPDLMSKGIPITEGIDPLSMLTTEGKNAKMMSEGLPADRISIENGAIITSCKRWPLVIDPQLQGIKWLREKEKDRGLVVLQLSQNQWLRKTETAIVNGHVLIIENVGEEIDATLDPVLGRAVYKKGSNLFLKLAGEEVQYDPNFFMYLQTKLSNPHYKPEIAAQCTLINFIATESGLEDQLLEKVVKKEQPELEAQKQELVLAFQKFKIDLVELEDQLLERLANAPDDILSDVPLIESLEETKKKATDISISVKKNQETEIVINNTRELYRPVAAEGAMLYFLLTTLSAIDHMYRYSLDSFITFFYNSIDRAPQSDKQSERVLNLRESLRITIFTWVSRGLFEAHKLIFLSQLTFNLMRRGILGEDVRVQEAYMQFLLRGPKKPAGGGGEEEANPIDWLPPAQWTAINMLAQLEEFQKMPQDLKEASSRFREWYNHVTPESEKLPLDWAGLDRTPFLKLLVVRCLRPDRMTVAVNEFVRQVLPNGSNYCDCDSALNALQVMDNSYLDSTPTTPLYFILSPGADVVAGVDKLSVKYGFERGVSYHNVSMGQGQDVFAMDRLEVAHRNGHWVILNNIHLMPRWLLALEKKLDEFALEGSHKNFRLFLTSDPSNSIPIGVLNRCIKLTNEPPSGLKANLKRAFVSFPKEYIEEAEGKVKSILFGLCHFHAVLMERKMYGPLGFNMMYPFSLGDLRDSAICLQNYLESSAGGKIPWADLRYIFGEIMYGGHIVNDFDRLLANTYLDFYMRDELLDEMEMFPNVGDEKGPSFMCLAPSSYDKYLEHIETELKTDSPLAFGLHPNAEIDFRTTQSENLFRTLMELQPRDAAAGDATMSPLELAKQGLEMVLSRVGEKKFECDEIARNLEEMGPYQNVFIQECEAMNGLLAEVVRSLNELSLGFAGELTMSDAMEAVQESLFLDRVPKSWEKLAFPSMRPLGSWLTNLEARLQQLEEWTQNPADIPRVTWLSGMINPQSFLTAIMQVTAQKNQWELDKLVIQTDVLKRRNGEVDAPSRDGAYIHGLFLMGARWDIQNNTVDRSHPKEMFSPMPVINCKAVAADKLDIKGSYVCPCYKTEFRGPTYVFSAQLKSKSPPARWVLAGVALIMDIV